MKFKSFFFFLFISFYIYSEEVTLEGSGYGLILQEKGFGNFFIIDENDNTLNLLDSGSYLNSRIYIKDADSRFYLRKQGKFVVIEDENSVSIKWRVLTLEVIEKYSIIENGFLYEITLKNRTNKDRNVGVYLMYDTYLGEEDGNHYLVDDYKEIKREKAYNNLEIPPSIKSINSSGYGVEFKFMTNPEIVPSKVLLGNWEKLAHSKKWPYSIKDGGLFSYGYYSVNDSGIAVLFNGINIEPLKSISYSYELKFLNLKKKSTNTAKEVKDIGSKWSDDEDEVLVEEEIEPAIIEDSVSLDEVNVLKDNVLDPEKEELRRMLEYIQKKKKGEDVSEYDFDEAYIIKKLKERNE